MTDVISLTNNWENAITLQKAQRKQTARKVLYYISLYLEENNQCDGKNRKQDLRSLVIRKQ